MGCGASSLPGLERPAVQNSNTVSAPTLSDLTPTCELQRASAKVEPAEPGVFLTIDKSLQTKQATTGLEGQPTQAASTVDQPGVAPTHLQVSAPPGVAAGSASADTEVPNSPVKAMIGAAGPLSATEAQESAKAALRKAVPLFLVEPNPTTDVTMRGVSLGFILSLVEAEAVDEADSIQEVVDLFVRPLTSAHGCCMFDVVPPAHVGKPRFFISHTWSRQLGSLLELLKEHFKVATSRDQAASVLIWLDIFAINQHPYTGNNGCLLNDDVANLANVVHSTERTLFCMDEECTALTRIWCLYEVWQTFDKGGAAQLLLLMPLVGMDALRRVFNSFDVMQAEATQPADRERIKSEIMASIGPTAMNLTLKRALIDSARFQANNTTGRDFAANLGIAAGLLDMNGEFDEALVVSRQAVAAAEKDLGPQDPTTLILTAHLAMCLTKLEQFEEALQLLQGVLAAHEQVLGPHHRNTLTTLSNMASCLNSMGRPDEALPLLLQALEARTTLLGPSHPNTLVSISQVASCHIELGQYEEALPMLITARDAMIAELGALHPDTLSTISNMAFCLERVGRQDEALVTLHQVLQSRRDVLGDKHPDTLMSISKVAACLDKLGRCEEALPLVRPVYEASDRVLGALHPSTLNYLAQLSLYLFKLEHFREALPLIHKVVESRAEVLGAEHPATALSRTRLSACIAKIAELDAAESL